MSFIQIRLLRVESARKIKEQKYILYMGGIQYEKSSINDPRTCDDRFAFGERKHRAGRQGRKVGGCVIASDGTVYTEGSGSLRSEYDSVFRELCRYGRRVNKGWIKYKWGYAPKILGYARSSKTIVQILRAAGAGL